MNCRKVMRKIFHIFLSCSAVAQTVYIGLALVMASVHTFHLHVSTGRLDKVVSTDIFTGTAVSHYSLSICNHSNASELSDASVISDASDISDASELSDNPASSEIIQRKGKKPNENKHKEGKHSKDTATYLKIQQDTYKAFKLYMVGIYLFYFVVSIFLCHGVILQHNWKGILVYIISGILALIVRATFITKNKHEVKDILICVLYGVYLLAVVEFMVYIILRLRRHKAVPSIKNCCF